MGIVSNILRTTFVSAGALALSGSIALAQADGPPDKVTKWVFQPAFDQTDAGWDNGVIPWVKAVEEATQGTVLIRVEPAGALTSGSEAFREQHGHRLVRDLQREHVKAIVAKLADRPAASNNWLKAIKILLRHAVEMGIRRDDPTAGLRKMRTGSTGFRTWTEAEIERFYEAHPVGSRARLALDLLLHTGQRRADVVRIGRQNVRAGVLTNTQQKTGTEVCIPLHPDLVASLDALPKKNMTFLLTEYGKPFTPDGFGNWFRDRVVEAKLPKGLSPHGLRKAACRRLAEAGCSANQIMAISGHRNLKEVTRYTDAASRSALARSAMNTVWNLAEGTETRTGIVKPASQV
ncbi:MAG: tyrosine-type recombinase/integrase [Roseovarius sp.]|nr:tyrosine-type recombinase/integrase [Roseovarius sp.]